MTLTAEQVGIVESVVSELEENLSLPALTGDVRTNFSMVSLWAGLNIVNALTERGLGGEDADAACLGNLDRVMNALMVKITVNPIKIDGV